MNKLKCSNEFVTYIKSTHFNVFIIPIFSLDISGTFIYNITNFLLITTKRLTTLRVKIKQIDYWKCTHFQLQPRPFSTINSIKFVQFGNLIEIEWTWKSGRIAVIVFGISTNTSLCSYHRNSTSVSKKSQGMPLPQMILFDFIIISIHSFLACLFSSLVYTRPSVRIMI